MPGTAVAFVNLAASRSTFPELRSTRERGGCQGTFFRCCCCCCCCCCWCGGDLLESHASERAVEVRGQGARGRGFAGAGLLRILAAVHRAPHQTEPWALHQAELTDVRAS